MGLLSLEEVIRATGEDDPCQVTQLLLRGKDLMGLEDDVGATLQALEVLSLSHNRFISLRQFDSFINLVELNLNFNLLTDLSGLNAPLLQKLYLSNNKLTSVSGLLRFPRLTTVCLYRNFIPDLAEVLSHIKQLNKLKSLDLDGNPCAQETGYKHHVVRGLPRLDHLDGERLHGIDRDLAEEYFMNQAATAFQDPVRPRTAPSKLGNRLSEAVSWDRGANPDDVTPSMARGDVSLLQDKRLNDNPIVLAYMAESTLSSPFRTRRRLPPSRESRDTDNDDGDSCCSSSNHNSLEDSYSQASASGPASSMPTCADEEEQCDNDREAPVVAGGFYSPHNPRESVDCSNPNLTIRKLLKLVEVLQQQAAQHSDQDRQRDLESEVHRLEEEVAWLRVENANVFILKQENMALKEQVEALTLVRHERDRLVREKRDLQQALHELQEPRGQQRQGLIADNSSSDDDNSDAALFHGSSTSTSRCKPIRGPVRNEVLVLEDYEEEEDREIAALIKKNEESLRQLRESMIQTKVELELEGYCSTRGDE